MLVFQKFLVIKGSARFGFRDILTDEKYDILTSGDVSQVVETIPGWTHDITNVGDDELVVMLWANENFDRDRKTGRGVPVALPPGKAHLVVLMPTHSPCCLSLGQSPDHNGVCLGR